MDSEQCELPDVLVNFLGLNGVCLTDYRRQLAEKVPRYIRVSTRSTLDVGASFPHETTSIERCESLTDFYRLSSHTRLACTFPYQDGQVYGIDLASGLAVHALDLQDHMFVWDVCAAPGAKLCMISEYMRRTGAIVATDVSPSRISVCRNILQKYSISNVDLIVCDGSKFGSKSNQFHRVLVDAECTPDGSFRHIEKHRQKGWKTIEKRFLDKCRLTSLATLQRQLLLNGFDKLAVDGILVYSTCSFCREQNEEVCLWLLAERKNARVIPVDVTIRSMSLESTILRDTVYLNPLRSHTSALFIARITKIK